MNFAFSRWSLHAARTDCEAASAQLLAERADFNRLAFAATDYLRMIGLLVLGWMWLKIAPVAGQAEDPAWRAMKQARAMFFATRILPETALAQQRFASGHGKFMDLADETF